MASKSSGFSFSTIIMGIIFYNLFFGGNDDENKKDVEGDKSGIKVKISAKIGEIKDGIESNPDLKQAFNDAKQSFNSAKEAFVDVKDEAIKEIKTRTDDEKELPKKKEKSMIAETDKHIDNTDVFSDDDRYGDYEQKW